MTKLRIATDKDAPKSDGVFLKLTAMGVIYLKMAPCVHGMRISFHAMCPTGLPEPLPQLLPKTVGEDHIHHRWFEKVLGISMERKTRKVLEKWRNKLSQQDRLILSTGASFSGSPDIEIVKKGPL